MCPFVPFNSLVKHHPAIWLSSPNLVLRKHIFLHSYLYSTKFFQFCQVFLLTFFNFNEILQLYNQLHISPLLNYNKSFRKKHKEYELRLKTKFIFLVMFYSISLHKRACCSDENEGLYFTAML